MKKNRHLAFTFIASLILILTGCGTKNSSKEFNTDNYDLKIESKYEKDENGTLNIQAKQAVRFDTNSKKLLNSDTTVTASDDTLILALSDDGINVLKDYDSALVDTSFPSINGRILTAPSDASLLEVIGDDKETDDTKVAPSTFQYVEYDANGLYGLSIGAELYQTIGLSEEYNGMIQPRSVKTKTFTFENQKLNFAVARKNIYFIKDGEYIGSSKDNPAVFSDYMVYDAASYASWNDEAKLGEDYKSTTIAYLAREIKEALMGYTFIEGKASGLFTVEIDNPDEIDFLDFENVQKVNFRILSTVDSSFTYKSTYYFKADVSKSVPTFFAFDRKNQFSNYFSSRTDENGDVHLNRGMDIGYIPALVPEKLSQDNVLSVLRSTFEVYLGYDYYKTRELLGLDSTSAIYEYYEEENTYSIEITFDLSDSSYPEAIRRKYYVGFDFSQPAD